MTTKDFESFKDHILTLNPYFTEGFANAFKDTLTSAIYVRSNGNLKAIFPEDRLGNYFYLRSDFDTSFSTKQGYEDCGAGKAIYDDRMTVYLIAVMDGADEFELVNNLRNTVIRFKDMVAIPVGALYQRENVLISEMEGFEENEIMKALTNIKNDTTIIRVQLQVTKEFVPNKCINNPCKECN